MPSRSKKHGRPSKSTAKTPHRRGSSTARGYGYQWQQLRQRVLAAEPLCVHCSAEGRVTLASDVDHKRPTKGLTDPLHFDESSLQPLCKPCHGAKTIRDTKKGLTR